MTKSGMKKFRPDGDISKTSEITAARICSKCGRESIVYDSRTVLGGRIERYRKCPFCGHKWITMEKYFRDVQKKA